MDFAAMVKAEREAFLREQQQGKEGKARQQQLNASKLTDSSAERHSGDCDVKDREDQQIVILRIEEDLVPFRVHPTHRIYYIPNVISSEDSERLLTIIKPQKGLSTSTGTGRSIEKIPETAAIWNKLDSSWSELPDRRLQLWGKRIDNNARRREISSKDGSRVVSVFDPVQDTESLLGTAGAVHNKPDEHGVSPSSTNNNSSSSSNRLKEYEVLPPWLESLARQLVHPQLYAPSEQPNHILINHYDNVGGIKHHSDGPMYKPLVAILSIGGPAMLTFRLPAGSGGGGGDGREGNEGEEGKRKGYSLVMQPESLVVFGDGMYTNYVHGIDSRSSSSSSSSSSVHSGYRSQNEEALFDVVDGPVSGECLNKAAAGVKTGDPVVRGPSRTSITFRFLP